MSRRKSSVSNGASIIVEPVADARSSPSSSPDDISDATDNPGAGNDTGTVDPAAVAAAGSDGNFPERKRRGRPPGVANKAKAVPSSVSGIEKTLYGIHQMLGAIIAPELAIDTDDAHRLADAMASVNKHYKIAFFDEKTQDWFNLVMVAGAMYGSRVVAIRDRRAASRVARPVIPRAQSTNPVPGNPAPRSSEMNGVAASPQDEAMRREASQGEIPGLGKIQFPEDHPLFPGRRSH